MSHVYKDNKELSFSVRLIASLLAVLFVISGVAGIVLFNIERRAFNPAPYKRALLTQDFYKQFPYLLGDLLAKNITGNAPAFLQHLSVDQWKGLFEALLPEQQLRSMMEGTLDQLFAYINGDAISPGISLVPLKDSLSGPAGMNAALTLIRSQPACTIQQIATMLGTFGQELCNPPQQMLDLLKPVIQLQLQAAASAIPDNISILLRANNGTSPPGLRGLTLIRLMMRLSPLVPLGLLFFVTILTVRSFKGWLIWWGWPLLFTGLIGFPLGISGAPLFRWAVELWLSKRINLDLPPEIAPSIRDVVDAALREILKPAAFESMALFIFGVIMVLFSAYLMSREKKRISASEAKTQIV